MKKSQSNKVGCKPKNELRKIVFGVLRANDRPGSFEELADRVAKILRTEDGGWKRRDPIMDAISSVPQDDPILNDEEEAILLEIYWDLFREKRITLGLDVNNFSIHSEAPKP